MAKRRRRRERGVEARRKKEFSYRGHTLEELKEMSLDEVAELVPARTRRHLERGFSVEHKKFYDRIQATDEEAVLRTHRRDFPVLPEMVGRAFEVHDGREFVRVDVEADMIGHLLGEFVMTRKEVKHTGPGVGATRSSKYMPLK